MPSSLCFRKILEEEIELDKVKSTLSKVENPYKKIYLGR